MTSRSERTTLDGLKRAISTVSEEPRLAPPIDQLSDLRNVRIQSAYNNAVAKAWRTAFEWREGWHERRYERTTIAKHEALMREGDEGMRLIREHLK